MFEIEKIVATAFSIDEGKSVIYFGQELEVPKFTNFVAVTPKGKLLAFYTIHSSNIATGMWEVHCDDIDDEVEDDWVNWTQDLYFPNSAATQEVEVGFAEFTGEWHESIKKV